MSRPPGICIVAVVALLGLAACGTASGGSSATTSRASVPAAVVSSAHAALPAPSACGSGAPEVLAQTAGSVAKRIYAGELAGSETQSDKRQVQEYGPLLSALESGSRGAVQAAVASLVFSHTHVVRLRVSRGTTVLADVGGPYILAPVSGSLRSHGRSIGHYVLSVQDDLGYVKLATRFIGAPLVMRSGARQVPVEGQLSPAPASIPAHGPVRYRGVSYQAFSFDASAFPSGPLRISLLLPLPGGLAAKSCAEVKSAELGLVAQRISRRFALSPGDFSAYIKLTGSLTGGLTYIRSGSRRLAGSTRPGPARLPTSGSVRYRGASYEVSSFEAPSSVGPVHVYELVTG